MLSWLSGNNPKGKFCNFTEFLFFGKFHLLCSKQFEMFSNRGLLSLNSNRGYNYYDEKNCAFCLMHRDVSSLQCSTDYICFLLENLTHTFKRIKTKLYLFLGQKETHWLHFGSWKILFGKF